MDSDAIKLLLWQYYSIQKLRVQTFNRIVGYVKDRRSQRGDGIQGTSAPKLPPSEVARMILKGELSAPEMEDLVWLHEKLHSTEKDLAKRLDNWSRGFPIRREWLDRVKGIGPVFASGLIAYLAPIERFPNVSKLWKYAGLAPGQRRKRGEKFDYNPKLKTLCWKIWNTFVKIDCFGRRLYLESKEYCRAKHPDWTKAHVHNWAGRRTVKIFLSCLWAEWRRLEGLPVTQPYAIQFLGHSDVVTPEMWVEK